jgi:Flp pilus assembly protein TadD
MQSLDEILDIGSRLVDNFKYDEALYYFSKAIQLYPNDPQAYDLKGIALFRLLKIDDAITEISKAIDCDPSFHLAYFHMAEVYMEQRDLKRAEYYCKESIRIEPENEFYSCTMAYIKLQLNEDVQCIEICDKILNFSPTNTYALEYRANAYMNKKDFENAISDLEILYTNTIENSTILNNLGYSYSKIGDTKLSKKYLLAAIKIDPGFSYPYDNLGYVYMLEGDVKKAHEFIDKSIELDHTNSYAFKNKALVFLKQNDSENAIVALEKAKALRFDLYYGDEVDVLLNALKGGAQ